MNYSDMTLDECAEYMRGEDEAGRTTSLTQDTVLRPVS